MADTVSDERMSQDTEQQIRDGETLQRIVESARRSFWDTITGAYDGRIDEAGSEIGEAIEREFDRVTYAAAAEWYFNCVRPRRPVEDAWNMLMDVIPNETRLEWERASGWTLVDLEKISRGIR